VAVADHHLDPAAGQLAGDLDRGPGVHHRIGDELTGEQHGVIDEAMAHGRGAVDEPGLQRVADKAARRSGGRRLRLVCRGRDKTVQSLHVPSPLPALLPRPRPTWAASWMRHVHRWRSSHRDRLTANFLAISHDRRASARVVTTRYPSRTREPP
jgi:hypothetical protein